VHGRLTSAAGSPVAGAALCVATRADRAGAPLRSGGTLRTDGHGRFSYADRGGTSKRIFFVYRTASGVAVASVMHRVRAFARLGVSRHSARTGESVTFRGRVRSRPLPRRGVLVELQARRPDGWQTFGRTIRTNRRGRFHYRYRFVRTTGIHTYSFRARIPGEQAAYPYATGTSRSVSVRVSG
jgi:hypothetical protein